MDFDFQGKYSAVRDYVRKIKKSKQEAYMVLYSLPGEEAQVDFGYIGTLKVNGKYKKAWVFVMVLCYSQIFVCPDSTGPIGKNLHSMPRKCHAVLWRRSPGGEDRQP
jgi:hypothetical protein